MKYQFEELFCRQDGNVLE